MKLQNVEMYQCLQPHCSTVKDLIDLISSMHHLSQMSLSSSPSNMPNHSIGQNSNLRKPHRPDSAL